jgi:predicted phosphodiesterase
MKAAIISDIHGNIGALNAVFNDIYSRGMRDDIYCLGDIIGYGSHPKECLDLVRGRCAGILKGNHEDMLFNMEYWENNLDNEMALRGLKYSAEQLTVGDLAFLKSLSSKQVFPGSNLTLAHAGFSDPVWKYIQSRDIASLEMSFLKTKVGIVGHTHRPVIYEMDVPHASDDVYCPSGTNIERSLGEVIKLIINVGSVGQPRDRDKRASYGIIEINRNKVKYQNVRVKYNVEQAAKYIRNAGLPERTATRLLQAD